MNDRKEITRREESIVEDRRNVSTISPLVDIYDNEDEILLYADMPGVDKKDISLNIDNGRLSVSGIRKDVSAGAAQWEEFGDVEYRRTFSVPQYIDIDKINAELSDGVLRLHLPKSETAKPKQIEIMAA